MLIEYRFLLVYGDPTTFPVPRFARVYGESMEDAVEKFAQEYNLSVDSIEGEYVWFMRKDDGTAHKYSVG
jgi:peptidoglycan hydrolase-like protein with peptidoglycan-binding domain